MKGLVGRELSDIKLLVELIIIIINGKIFLFFFYNLFFVFIFTIIYDFIKKVMYIRIFWLSHFHSLALSYMLLFRANVKDIYIYTHIHTLI